MLSKRLAELLLILGIKKIDFADKIGFTPAYLSMILSGKRQEPSDRFFDAVCREFSINEDWLREGTGEVFFIPNTDLSESDRALLQKYHRLPIAERKIVDEVIDSLLYRALQEDSEQSQPLS